MTLPKNVEDSVDSLRVALNDWTATYASEFCDEDSVKAAHKRISTRGTLSYICGAMASLDTIRAELHRLTDRLEAAERDAARYRWLRTLQGDVLTKKWNGESWGDASYIELDAAIDAAMQESGDRRTPERL